MREFLPFDGCLHRADGYFWYRTLTRKVEIGSVLDFEPFLAPVGTRKSWCGGGHGSSCIVCRDSVSRNPFARATSNLAKEDCRKAAARTTTGSASGALEVAAKFAESWQDDQLSGSSHDRLVLELPGVLVRDIDGVEADFHGGIDVAARAVADHPPVGLDDFVFVYESAVGVGIFLRHDFDEFKEALQARSLDLRGLLGGLAFR